MDAAIKHCTTGIGIWGWASNDQGVEPDVVMACAGDVPTLETLAAVDLLYQHFPDLKVRVVNVVDLMKLLPEKEHPHGLSDKDFDSIFTPDKPIVFAFHGYPWLIHRLTYRRTNHHNLHVRGYKEEGTTTTPFDMVVLNELDRFSLVDDAIDRVPKLKYTAAHVKQMLHNKLIEHKHYITEHGEYYLLPPPAVQKTVLTKSRFFLLGVPQAQLTSFATLFDPCLSIYIRGGLVCPIAPQLLALLVLGLPVSSK